jgi:hypothetical protein
MFTSAKKRKKNKKAKKKNRSACFFSDRIESDFVE